MIDDKNIYPMTDWQHKELDWRLRAYSLCCLGAFLLGGYVVLSAVLQIPSNSNALIGLGIFAPITCWACVFTAYKARQIKLDLGEGIVESINGVVRLKKGITGFRSAARLQVNDFYFYFQRNKLPDLREQQPYRVYYSPRSKIYLGAEPLF